MISLLTDGCAKGPTLNVRHSTTILAQDGPIYGSIDSSSHDLCRTSLSCSLEPDFWLQEKPLAASRLDEGFQGLSHLWAAG